MNIFLMIGHEPEGENITDEDLKKELSEKEISDIQKRLPGMKKITGQIDYIITSTPIRARYTAGVVAAFYKCSMFIDPDDALSAPGKEKETIKHINKLIGKENVVVIGQNPNIGELIKAMTGSGEVQKEIILKNKDLALVHYRGFILPREGKLEWIKELV